MNYDEAFKASLEYFDGDDLAASVFLGKYALQDEGGELLESTPKDMHKRLAKEFARIEAKYPNPLSEKKIFNYLDKFEKIIPQGSPMSGIGNDYQVQSISNCFVVPNVEDSYAGIMMTDQQLAQIMKRRGGVGVDISNLRPKGLRTNNAAGTTDGIGVFMERFSNTTREVAQCISEGQRVLTRRGLLPIEKVLAGQDEVWTQDRWMLVQDVVSSGSKEVYKTTTERGYSIVTSADHIFVDEENNERRLKDFELNRPIALIPGSHFNSDYVELKAFESEGLHNRTNLDVSLPGILTEDLAYLIGYSYGDGYVNRNKHGIPNSVDLACAHDRPDIQEKLHEIIKETFGIEGTVRSGSGAVNRLNVNSFIVVNFLMQNQMLKEKSADIQMPDHIMRSPVSVQAAFLSGCFDADGYASGAKKGYVFNSISKPFLEQVQIILMSIGIVSRLSVEDRSSLGWNNLYSLSVTGSWAQGNFVNLMRESLKVAKLGFIAKRDNLLTPYRLSNLGVKRAGRSYVNESQLLSASAFSRLGDEIPMPQMLVLDKISTIESLGVKKTYDLVVPGVNMFWCEGFYVHNSGRRGALMISISVHHPEIETFINVKRDMKRVTGANISIRLSNDFMNAVKNKEKYEMRWPVDSENPVMVENADAEEIWTQIIESAHATAEPGLLFWDNIIERSPADCYPGFETISTNPCGELPLSAGDSCRLLLVNVLSFVKDPFGDPQFDYENFAETCFIAQRLMDDMVDLELENIDKIIDKIDNDPESDDVKYYERSLWNFIRAACFNGRRTGLGVTAVGDAVAAMGLRYGSDESIEFIEEIYKTLAVSSYDCSITLAEERGAFPVFDYELEKDHEFINQILEQKDDLKERRQKFGRRNIANTTTAPAGSVSVLTQTTSGIEPAFMTSYTRRKKVNPNDKNATVDFVDDMGDKWQEFTVYHHQFKKWMEITGLEDVKESPYHNATANNIDWSAKVRAQAAAQKWICHAISNTTNVPEDTPVEVVKDIYMTGYESGCKGVTIYREGSRSGVLVSTPKEESFDGIQINHAPKRPIELKCDVHHMTVLGEKWLMFIGLLDGKPYELMGGPSKYVSLPKRVRAGKVVKVNGSTTHPAMYDFHYDYEQDPEDTTIIKDINSVFSNATHAAFTRTISLALRHGTPIRYVVEQIQKGAEKETDLFTFSKAASRVLKQYIENGIVVTGKKCLDCGSESLIYEEGCMKCTSCGGSKCG